MLRSASTTRRIPVLRTVAVAALAAAALSLIRSLAATRTPRRDPEQGPVIGSVDTWPAVPRSPEKRRGAA